MNLLFKPIGRSVVICLCLANAVSVSAQNASVSGDKVSAPVTSKPLNLDSSAIAAQISKEEPVEKPTEVLSAGPNKVDEIFKKAEKHDAVPTMVEINTPGSPQRVTKVTGADGSYCVYSPAVGRTDGIDEIQNGLQKQVRSCPN